VCFNGGAREPLFRVWGDAGAAERETKGRKFFLPAGWPPHDDQTMDHKGQSARINYCSCKYSVFCVLGAAPLLPYTEGMVCVLDRGAKIGSQAPMG
jgi:hypothetical protein